ncbi:MAG TPA: hypothetical protein DDX92_10055 [Flavobacteriales bacterium]|jgi:hypothetical protein|nr:hypothetical protein [Flavobacteriales bacterium]
MKGIFNFIMSGVMLVQIMAQFGCTKAQNSFEFRNGNFKYRNLEVFDIYSDFAPAKGLYEFPSDVATQIIRYVDEIEGEASNYTVQAYSIQELENGKSSIYSFAIKGDNYCSLVLFINESPYQTLTVAGGYCFGPAENKETGEIEWCEEKFSEFNGSSLYIYKVQSKSESYLEGSNEKNDTILNKYDIAPKKGAFIKVN